MQSSFEGGAPRGHVINDGIVVGQFLDDGTVIATDRIAPPISGPISLSTFGQYLLGQNKMWLSNGYLKDLTQSPDQRRLMSSLYGAVWGQPHQTTTEGAGMAITKFDWRFGGDHNVTAESYSVQGGYGSTSATAIIKNNPTMAGPAAFNGNGYFKADPGRYSFEYSWGGRTKYQQGSGTTKSDMYAAVYGYRNGYVNGPRTEYVPYHQIGDKVSGKNSFSFTTSSSYPHIVVNFVWWCDKWNGSEEGISGTFEKARCWRTS